MQRFLPNSRMVRVGRCEYANHANPASDIVEHTIGVCNSQCPHSKLSDLQFHVLERELISKNQSNCLQLPGHHRPGRLIYLGERKGPTNQSVPRLQIRAQTETYDPLLNCCITHLETFIMRLISLASVLPVLVTTLIASSFSSAA